MDVQRFWIYIDGTEVASDKEFTHPDVTDDVHLLRFWTIQQPVGTQDAYVIDDITIMGPKKTSR
jgi:hypothetical protein